MKVQYKALPQPLLNREFERRPDLDFMVARDSFKYRFKISELTLDSFPFLENILKTTSK
jgi:hypothetical protein